MACSHQRHPCCPIQGHIWNKGFKSGAMTSELFRDVPDVLTELRLAGVKTYIYSSGSREAQKLFFGHCQVDDDDGQGLIVFPKNSPLKLHVHPASLIPVH